MNAYVVAMVMLLALIAAVGCHPLPPVPPTSINLDPACAMADGGAPTTADVCAGLVTPDDRACVRCPANRGCYDVADRVWCTSTADCSDPRCRPDVL